MTNDYFLLKKLCGDCGHYLPRTAFNRRSAVKDGLQPVCRPCAKTRQSVWRDQNPDKETAYRQANRDHERERQRAWAAANPSKKAATYRRWYAKHGDAYREANRASFLSANRQYRSRHLQENNARVARRRAIQMRAFIEDVDRVAVWLRDGGTCYLCHQPANPDRWHLDHVVPLTRGGEHSYANTAVTYPRCNMRKGNLTPDEHWARLTRLKWNAYLRMERTAQTSGG